MRDGGYLRDSTDRMQHGGPKGREKKRCGSIGGDEDKPEAVKEGRHVAGEGGCSIGRQEQQPRQEKQEEQELPIKRLEGASRQLHNQGLRGRFHGSVDQGRHDHQGDCYRGQVGTPKNQDSDWQVVLLGIAQ